MQNSEVFRWVFVVVVSCEQMICGEAVVCLAFGFVRWSRKELSSKRLLICKWSAMKVVTIRFSFV